MNETTKESKFLDAINQYAEKQKALISSEVENYKAQKIEQATESGLKDAYELIQRDIAERKSAIVTEYAQKEYDLRRELFMERERLAESVFAEVLDKLAEYSSTPEYRAAVVRSAKEASELCGDSACTVLIKPADMSLSDEIRSCFAEASVIADDTVTVGGIKVICEDKGLVIDDTLDTRLSGQRAWFAMNSGLKVV